MGEVWKAVDTQLDREVAIKVLPAALSGDRERLARLEREAKLLASLNHPNIAAIYGFPAADVRFLAMELVRGEDLAQILARGPMPVREALEAARQVAAALEAAHDSGVIHRDLKPANVKRTPEGQIKVLDFGLAKTLMPSAPSSPQSATVTSAGSVAGLILGTASYMSPEQARGQPVDRRTDLWAFGCLLYEMLSGTKAFDGATVTDVLAAVVTGEPDWTKLPAETPASVRRLLRRCLEKDARKRLRDAGDASLLLDDNPDDAKTAPVPRVPAARSTALPAIGAAVVIALIGLAGGGWIAHRAGGAGTPPEIAFHRVTFSRGMMRSARFAPDGRTFIYGAAWDGPPIKLYLARTESAETTPISLPPAELLSIGKSGDMAVALNYAFYGWMADGTLARTSLLGGAPREILEHVRAADWSPDGSQFAVVRVAGGYDQIEYPVGTVLAKTTGYFADIRISPDGERIAFADHPSWGDNRGNVAVIDRSGKKTMLAQDFAAVQGVAWGPGGREVWFTGVSGDQGSALYAVDLAGKRRSIYTSLAQIELFDIAADGRVLLGSQRQEREAVALLAGYVEPRNLVIPGESSIVRTVSPDGRSVLVANQIPKDYETFVIRSDRPGAVRLCSGESGAISPDGDWALTSSADYKTFFVSPLGMGPTRQIPNPEGIEYSSIGSWLPDGKHIVVVAHSRSAPARGYVIDIATGAGKGFGAPGVMWPLFTSPPVSPDGKYVVLQDKEGMPKRWPMEGGEPLAIPGLLADDLPVMWTADGAALFMARKEIPIPIVRVDLASGRRSAWTTVTPTDSAGLRFAIATITPNGKYWALSVAKLMSDLYVVDGLR